MSRRVLILALLFLLIFASVVGVFISLGRGPISFIGTPLLTGLNAPPEVDPQCPDRLRAQPGVRLALAEGFERVPGCLVEGAVLVRELAGIELRPQAPLMRCEVAEALNAWLEKDVKPLALEALGSPITQVRHMGTYSCRSIAGSRNLSQHSFANAIDISAFRLANGKRFDLLKGWDAQNLQVQKFWRKIHRHSCRHFSVALGPDYNTAHGDHFHFDLGPMRACQ